jgi:hypothetical protein
MRRRNMPGPIRWREPSPGSDQQRLVVVAGDASVGGAKLTHAAARALKQTLLGVRGRTERELAAAQDIGEWATPQPLGGDWGPAGIRSRWRLRIETHQATPGVLAVAYSFLAEEGLGSPGVLVGQDYWTGMANCYDLRVNNNSGEAAA